MGPDAGPPPDPFVSLRALYGKVERHWDRELDGKSLRCAPGCVSCCHTSFGVCRVEADFIIDAWDGLPPPEQGRSRVAPQWVLGEPSTPPCAFLTPGGLCRIYPVRPLICRSHGMPVLADGVIDVCPANSHLVTGVAPLNLELLNTILFAIDAVYCREQGRPPVRVSLQEVAARLEV